MNTPTVLVTGATGNIGRPLVGGLLADGARVPGPDPRPRCGRHPRRSRARRGRGVRQHRGLRQHAGELIAAARGAGVSKIVMLSSIAVRDEGAQVLSLGRQHKAVEDAVKAAEIDWTILRCGGFAANTLTWAASVRAEGVVRFPYGKAALA